jgi:hypothetical protein
MLTSLQFPLADSRAFIDSDVGLLTRPAWPALVPDYEFVRSFGSIRKRKLGGLVGWVGEHAVCEATRAMRFRSLPKLQYPGLERISLSVPYRRFYFDGLAVGKFDVGFATQSTAPVDLSRAAAKQLIYELLDQTVDVPCYPTGFATSKFLLASKHLAKLYLTATTKVSHIDKTEVQSWWVRPGPSLFFIVVPPDETVKMPFREMRIPIDQNLGFEMSHCVIPHGGRNLPMWLLRLNSNQNLTMARALRICLLRLHAEHECLKLILQNILSNRFDLKPRSTASDTLQRYLNEAIRRISRLGNESKQLDSELAEFARISDDTINPGERDAILESLANIDVRRNIFNKVREYVDQTIHVQEQIMGDRYTIGQAGAVGPQSSAQNFHQLWQEIHEGTDLGSLAKDLEKLRRALLKEANTPDDYAIIGHVSSAEAAAKQNNGPKTLEYLARTGRWAMDVATKIGTTLAASALKDSLGIK